MNLFEAIIFFENLSSQPSKNAELRIYKSFIKVLNNVQNRPFNDEEFARINQNVEALDLTNFPKNKKRFFRKKLHEFCLYLKKDFSLVREGHYSYMGMLYGMIYGTGLGISLGAGFGQGTGVAYGMSIGTGVGMAIGMFMGSAKDQKAKKENRVLN